MKNATLRLLFLALCLFLPGFSNAQGLRFGLKAGAGWSTFDFEPDVPVAETDDSDFLGPRNVTGGTYKPSFMLGGMLEYDLSKDFVLASGVQAALKYSKHMVPYAYSTEPNRYRYNLIYLQVPATIYYRRGRVFAGLGGYAAWALAGKWHNDIQNDKPQFYAVSGDLQFGNDPEVSNLQRFDYGVRGELGYGLKQVRLSLSFDQGIPKLASSNALTFYDGHYSELEKGSLRNQAIYLTAAYYWLAK